MFKELNGLKSCGFNKPSISKFHVFMFDEINEYRYNDDDLNFITAYTAAALPTTYRPHKSQSFYSGTQSNSEFELFEHQLTLNFPKLEKDKRKEFKSLKGLKLTIIFEDDNGNSWIMGKDFPCLFVSLALSTGAKDGQNDYTLILESSEKEQLKEIEQINESCFSSVVVDENRFSVITFDDADTLTYVEFSFSADERVYNHNMIPAISPTLWAAIPSLKLSDDLRLLSMFEIGGTIEHFSTSYDVGTKVLTFNIQSPDTSYGSMLIGGVSETSSLVHITLGFTTVLSPSIANSNTTITLKDSNNNIIYSDEYGAALTGNPDIIGTTNDSELIISNLYPEQDVTLIFELDGVNCDLFAYKYHYERTVSLCIQSVDFEFFKGSKQKIFIPYVAFNHASNTGEQSPDLQDITINIDGAFYEFYQNVDSWNSDLVQFEADFKAMLIQSGSDLIDVSTISFTDVGTGVEIDFFTTGIIPEQSNPYFDSDVRGETQPVETHIGWTQSRALQLKTGAPISSNVKHTDQHTNEIEGNYLVNITSNGTFELLNVPATSNQSIENIAFNYAFDASLPYSEGSTVETKSVSGVCSAPDITTQFKRCYGGFSSITEHYHIVCVLDASTGGENAGNIFEFTINGVVTTVVSPAPLTPSTNAHYVTKLFNQIKGLSLMAYRFDATFMKYHFYFMVEDFSTLTNVFEVTAGRTFSLSSILPIYTTKIKGKMNPYITVDWGTLPTVVVSVDIGPKNLTVGEFQTDLGGVDIIRLDWVALSDEMTVTRLITTAPFDAKELTFDIYTWEDYPQNGVSPVYSFTLASLSNVVIDSNIGGALGNLEDGGFIVYTNEFGRSVVKAFDFENDGTFEFVEIEKRPLIWGTLDEIRYVGTAITSVNPVINSAFCGSDIDIQDINVVHSTATTKTTVIVTIDGTDRVNVNEVEVTITPTNGGSLADPTSYIMDEISDNGTEAVYETTAVQYDNPNEVLGFLYDIAFSFKDALDVELLAHVENIEIEGA